MTSKFLPAGELTRQQLDWGSLGWCSRPADTGAKDLAVIEVTLAPGGGHAFHKHPSQEELIYVIEGRVEQWLDQECRTLGPGDCVFIDGDVVHASFNTSQQPCRMLAILGPCVAGDDGYESVEVADQEPWRSLRRK